MDYHEFLACWIAALRDAPFENLGGLDPMRESIDTRILDRQVESVVLPARQHGDPFWVSGRFEWRWSAAHTARTTTTEEDFLADVLAVDYDHLSRVQSRPPWIRVDVKLTANLQDNQMIPLPSSSAWSAFATEATTRLEHVERLVSEEVQLDEVGQVEILAWAGQPRIEAECRSDGSLWLRSVSVSAWQGVDLPRQWDDPSRDRDPDPRAALDAMFERVASAMHLWTELTDHLRPTATPK